MAEAALASIAKSALQLFSSLAKDEFLLLWNSKKDLKRLETTIETITKIHQDAAERGPNEDSVQRCLYRMRNVMYDAEDFFDTLVAKILHKRMMAGYAFTKEVRLFFSDANHLGLIYKTAHGIKDIRESLDDIKKDMEIYGLIRQQPPVAQPFVRPKTHSFVPNEDIIGRDEDRDRVINVLLPQSEEATSSNNSLSVVAIIGFGGLGKTALAQYVYNDERVKQGFDVHLWACINYLSDLEQVFIEIIASKEKKYFDLGLERLQEKLRGIISGRKFILVLDDVWDENSGNWMNLERILRCGKVGSKVLVTTRSRKVVECVDAAKPNCCVDLEVLSDESAWSLFMKKAFENEDELNGHPELEPLGKKIVDRCGNVPLAVIIVGSLLRYKKDRKTWSDFLEKDLKRTIIAKSGGENNHESIKSVLMVSYNDLHSNLKLCFAYCSLFPKDYKFDKDVLVRLWIAQGFIKPCAESEQSLEKEGEEYFFHLAERCFFQEVTKKDTFDFNSENDRYGHTAKMHDLLHDMAIEVGKTESTFIDKVSIRNSGKKGNLRHISVNCEVENSSDYCSLVSDPETVRTLVIHHGKQFNKDPLNRSLARFRTLRTLHLALLRIDKISESLGELIHLRYLNLSDNNKLKHLPNSICKLHRLMILVLENCVLLKDLPPKIEKLLSLRQLYIDGCESLGCIPSGLRALTSLVKLDRLIVHRQTGGLSYLKDLVNLHEVLKIELPGEGWVDAIEDARKANMKGKPNLSGMVIEWKEGNGGYNSSKMPKDETKAVLDALEPHENLEYLKISNYGGEVLSAWFGTLKNVTELRLDGCEQVEYLEDEVRGDLYFPLLKTLTLGSLYSLKGWWRQQVVEETNRPRLPKVLSVRISHCPKLKGRMPLLPEVKDLTLEGVKMEVLSELRIGDINPNNNLKTLVLHPIGGLMSLPEGWLRHLTRLEELNIGYCRGLKSVSCWGLEHLTALKELSLNSGEIIDIGGEDGMPWRALKGLVSLSVPGPDEHFLEGLPHLTSLERLWITNWKEEEAGDEEMKAGRLQNLQKFEIGFGGKIARLPKVIQYLPALKDLGINNCKELHLGWKTLLSSKLEKLAFTNVKKVIDVEDKAVEQQSQLRNFTIKEVASAEWVSDVPWSSLCCLHFLFLCDIRGMKKLPEGIQHLILLQELWISGCSEVTSLPIWIPKLTSLIDLTIRGCSSELERRCEEGQGEDWPLIRHLPYIDITRDDDDEAEGSRRKEGCGCGLSPAKLFHF